MSEVRIKEVKSILEIVHILKHTAEGDSVAQQKAVTLYLKKSDKTYAGLVDDDIVCVWGIIRQSLLSNRGYIWLLTTDKAEDHKFLLVRYSQRIIERLAGDYAVLCGECLVGDLRARKWMKLLGAQFGAPEGRTIPFQIAR